jgi:bifunctional lysine-specific demethylase and histidyl-hydroxylase NO66
MNDDATAFTRLSGLLGRDATEFLNSVWGRTPLHLSGVDPSSFKSLATLEKFDQILSYDSTRPPYLRLFKAGSVVDIEEYTYSGSVARRDVTGLLDQQRLMELFDDGCTIVLDSIHHWIPEVRDLCFDLQEELGGAGRATAFITPPHEFGLDLHADAYEIFVLQIAGSKEWSLYPRLDPVPRNGLNLDPADFADVTPDVVVLQEGDLLYVPWGTPHSVKPVGSLSAHISVAVNFPTWADVVSQVLEFLLDDEGLNGAAHLSPAMEQTFAAELKARLDDLAGEISALDVGDIAAKLVEYASSPERRQPNTTLASH